MGTERGRLPDSNAAHFRLRGLHDGKAGGFRGRDHKQRFPVRADFRALLRRDIGDNAFHGGEHLTQLDIAAGGFPLSALILQGEFLRGQIALLHRDAQLRGREDLIDRGALIPDRIPFALSLFVSDSRSCAGVVEFLLAVRFVLGRFNPGTGRFRRRSRAGKVQLRLSG